MKLINFALGARFPMLGEFNMNVQLNLLFCSQTYDYWEFRVRVPHFRNLRVLGDHLK